MTRHFLKDDDITTAEQAEILELAIALKKDPYSEKVFAGPKTVALIFDKTSTRTRVSFSVGVSDLGGVPLVMDSGTSQLGAKESVADTARVLERQVAQIVWRTYAQSSLEEMAQHSRVPVINSLSDSWHPCQLLADLMTIREHFGHTDGVKIAYIGDAANNMGNSYLIACAMAGMHVSIGAPARYQPDVEVVRRAQEIAKQFGSVIEVHERPEDAVRHAHVVATDTWVSMGMEKEKQKRIKIFADYTVTNRLLELADPSVIFLHCLPAYRGYEVAADVIDGPRSFIWEEAENRLHAQKALMVWLDRQQKLGK